MKLLSMLMAGLLLVYAFAGLQDVRADEADEADEDYKFGLKYYHGNGVTQDYTEAIKWLHKAANQGHQKAKELLQKLQ